ncbi:MAG: hypothetical protein K8L99_08955 [Anaerolineae bacterium]|nr:hypothetical protein [Anaerolineae bacterium]
MSNRSDFEFDNDDEFEFDDDEFQFEDDDDIDFEGGLGDDFQDEDLAFDEDQEEGRGPSRTFIAIAGLMILLFIVALVALFFLSNRGPSELDVTRTAIALINSTTIAQGLETETQQAFDRLTETQLAFEMTQTAQAPTATPTSTLTPTETATPPLDATDIAATQIAIQAELDMTASAQPSPTREPSGTPPPGVSDINAVAQTATALAGVLQPPTEVADGQGGGVVATPTGEGFGEPLPTALPDTGLFDDLAAGGGGSLGLLALAIVGLAGVIFVSRRLRTNLK